MSGAAELMLARPAGAVVPTLITAAGDRAQRRFLEFFTANIRNPHTRRAYGRAAADFLAWCEAAGLTGTTWPVTSQSNRWRTAARRCFTVGADSARVCASIQVATCSG